MAHNAPAAPTFTVIVNNSEFTTSEHVLTGLQVKELAGIPADYELFQLKGSNSVPVANDEQVHIHEKIAFRAIPVGTFGMTPDAAR